MREDGSRERNVRPDGAEENYPGFSPNGRRIAFERTRGAADIEVAVAGADGSHLKELTHNDDPDFAPVFSPDGTRIAYDSLGDVRVMRTDGSHKHRLTFDPDTDEYADWAPRP
jgi:TolB protein